MKEQDIKLLPREIRAEYRNRRLHRESDLLELCNSKLYDAASEDDFVDIVRTASLRAGRAVYNGSEEWKFKWYGLKYNALVRAVGYIHDEHKLELDLSKEIDCEGRDRIAFTFYTRHKPYKTFASPFILKCMLGREEYKKYFGNLKTN